LTKVVATLGPASQNRLEEMILAGVDVFRLNFSHSRGGDYAQYDPIIANIRAASTKLDIPVAIMGDLQGPKFRIGELKDHQAIPLVKGSKIKFSVGNEVGDETHIYTKNEPVITGLSIGHKVLLDDGTLELKVVERHSPNSITCEVIVGGKLGEKKGINVPDIYVSSRLSEKDKLDATYAVQQGLDYICASFVQTAEDIIELREWMLAHAPEEFKKPLDPKNPSHISKNVSWANKLPLIIAKIEKPQAVDNIKSIVEATDGIMVARGDLGVEMSLERVPAIQRLLIELCTLAQKPVITATQMLQSMIENPVPTRAEVSDVANAVFDGSDCVMLSAESAVGQYPVETVKTMVRIIEEAEKDLGPSHRRRQLLFRDRQGHHDPSTSLSFHETIARTAVAAAEASGCVAIVVTSYSGLMANRISKAKPDVPIIAFTPDIHAYRRLALIGAVHPLILQFGTSFDEDLAKIDNEIAKRGLLKKGDPVLFSAGTTTLPSLSNMIKLFHHGDLLKH